MSELFEGFHGNLGTNLMKTQFSERELCDVFMIAITCKVLRKIVCCLQCRHFFRGNSKLKFPVIFSLYM